jgi:hypothetical protein
MEIKRRCDLRGSKLKDGGMLQALQGGLGHRARASMIIAGREVCFIYFQRRSDGFMELHRFPPSGDLAACSSDEILKFFILFLALINIP